MSKSTSRKLKEIQNKKDKKSKSDPKRANKRRGEHGCARLHALREDDVKVELPGKTNKKNVGLISKVKNLLRR